MAIGTSALLKITGAAVLTGSITLGALTTWNGSGNIDAAVNKIQAQAQKINVFADQQGQLVSKINELKTVRSNLNAQIATLQNAGSSNDATIADLQAQLDAADAQILDLQSQLNTANANGETLAQRIVALEDQLTAANEDAQRLQAAADSTTTTAEPMSTTELATVTETEATAAPEQLTYKLYSGTQSPIPGIEITTVTGAIQVTNKTGKDITIQGIPGGAIETIYTGNYKVVGISTEYIDITHDGITDRVYIVQ